jgi:cytochrome c-type biogenesis protein CcmH/NrfG
MRTLIPGTLPHHGRCVNSLTLAPDTRQAYACSMTQSSHERDEAQRREALAALRELSERESVVSSALARSARRAGDHFAAKDAGQDRIEAWGRRIGRGLSLAGFVALAIYLYITHFR